MICIQLKDGHGVEVDWDKERLELVLNVLKESTFISLTGRLFKNYDKEIGEEELIVDDDTIIINSDNIAFIYNYD